MTLDAVVVGAGIGGLTAAHTLATAGLRPLVLEAGPQVGGLVHGGRVGDQVVDLGAESFGLRRPEAADLATSLGLQVQVPAVGSSVWAADGDRPTGSQQHGPLGIPARSLLGIPADPLAPDVVAVIGPDAARRAAADLRLDPAIGAESTTLAELVTDRMGRDVLDRLVRPVAGGIHATEPEQLAVDAVVPGLRAALAAHGSLARAVAATLPDGAAVGSIVGGMWRLPAALAGSTALAGVPVTVRTGSPVIAVTREPDGAWVVRTDEELRTRRLVLATPGPEALDLLAGPLPGKGPVLRPGTPLVHVTLVVESPALDAAPVGSGVLVPPGAPGVQAKALTQLTAKWGWLGSSIGPGVHVLRLSYGRPGEAPATLEGVGAETARRDAQLLLDTPIDARQVSGSRRTPRPAGIPPSVAGSPDLQPLLGRVHEAGGLALCGAWVAGTGIAAVVPHAQAEARRLLDS